MRNRSVKVLRRVGAHPGACFGRDFHNVFSQFYSFSDEWHAVQKVPPGPLPRRQLVRCLVCLSKRKKKDTGNTTPEETRFTPHSETSAAPKSSSHLYDVLQRLRFPESRSLTSSFEQYCVIEPVRSSRRRCACFWKSWGIRSVCATGLEFSRVRMSVPALPGEPPSFNGLREVSGAKCEEGAGCRYASAIRLSERVSRNPLSRFLMFGTWELARRNDGPISPVR
jgi:hypothetical protein